MVPVTVDREQAEFETIARELQVELAEISAEKNAKIAAAEAIGKAISSAKMNVWGDPNSMNQLRQSFFKGQQNGQFGEELANGFLDEAKELIASALSGVGGAAGKLAELLKSKTGAGEVPAEQERSE